ncbi:MAG: hypothetical protein Q9186_002811 [Xanthomendoza sp. 1 TL-2023]
MENRGLENGGCSETDPPLIQRERHLKKIRYMTSKDFQYRIDELCCLIELQNAMSRLEQVFGVAAASLSEILRGETLRADFCLVGRLIEETDEIHDTYLPILVFHTNKAFRRVVIATNVLFTGRRRIVMSLVDEKTWTSKQKKLLADMRETMHPFALELLSYGTPDDCKWVGMSESGCRLVWANAAALRANMMHGWRAELDRELLLLREQPTMTSQRAAAKPS